MRIAILIAGFLISFGMFQPIKAQEGPGTGDLTILVTGFKSGEGNAMIKVMSSEQALTNEDKAFSMIRCKITGGKVEVTLRGVPHGQYAVAVFHDRNGNGVLDKNLRGIPKEEYGFSNNAKGKFGPPDYKSMRFDLRSPSVTQQIIIR